MPQKTLFSEEQVQFIRKNVKGRPRKEMLQLVNEKFNLDIQMNQWLAWMKNHGITSGRDGRFKPGHVPDNKGKKGNYGYEPTQFKKGHRPVNYMPVGSERVNTDGYVDVKIADPNKWRPKHHLLWEEANGPVPKGHCLIFADRNKLNVVLDNLILITRKQLSIMNRHHLIQTDAELTKTGIILADIHAKVVDRKKKK